MIKQESNKNKLFYEIIQKGIYILKMIKCKKMKVIERKNIEKI